VPSGLDLVLGKVDEVVRSGVVCGKVLEGDLSVEALAELPSERSGRNPTLQNTKKTACLPRWRDDLRVVRGSFARTSVGRASGYEWHR
jgi:hypothetical protein